MKTKCGALHPVSFGLALGIISGVSILIMALLDLFAGGYGDSYVKFVGTLYIGYAPTLLGSLIGLVYGFIDGFILGVIFAWLYNCFCCKACKCCEIEEKKEV